MYFAHLEARLHPTSATGVRQTTCGQADLWPHELYTLFDPRVLPAITELVQQWLNGQRVLGVQRSTLTTKFDRR